MRQRMPAKKIAMPPNRDTDFVCNVCGDCRILTIPFFPTIFEINISKIEKRKDIRKMSDIMNNLPLNFLVLA